MKLFVVLKLENTNETTAVSFPTKGGVIRYLVDELELGSYDSEEANQPFSDLDTEGLDFFIVDLEDPNNPESINLMRDYEDFFDFLEAFDPDNHYREGAKESVIIRFNKF